MLRSSQLLQLAGLELSVYSIESEIHISLILTHDVDGLTQLNNIGEVHTVTKEVSGCGHNGYVVAGSIVQTSQ